MKLSDIKYYNNFVIEILLGLDHLSDVDISPSSDNEEKISNLLRETEVDFDTERNLVVFFFSSQLKEIATILGVNESQLATLLNDTAAELSYIFDETINETSNKTMEFNKLPTIEELHEAKMTRVKRSHGENHPAIKADIDAKMRNKVIEFMGSHNKGRVSKEELDEFFNQMNEDDTPINAPSKSWVYKNSKLIERKKVKGGKCYELTRAGKNLYERLKAAAEKTNESKLNESGELSDENIIAKYNALKKATPGITRGDAIKQVASDLNIGQTEVLNTLTRHEIKESNLSIINQVKDDSGIKKEFDRIDKIKNKDDKLLEIELLNKDMKLSDNDLNILKNDFVTIYKSVNESSIPPNEEIQQYIGAALEAESEFTGEKQITIKKKLNTAEQQGLADHISKFAMSAVIEVIGDTTVVELNETVEKVEKYNDKYKLGEVVRLMNMAAEHPEPEYEQQAYDELRWYLDSYTKEKDKGETQLFGRPIDDLIGEYQQAIDELIKNADSKIDETPKSNFDDIAEFYRDKNVDTLQKMDMSKFPPRELKETMEHGSKMYEAEWESPSPGQGDKLSSYPEEIKTAIKFWKAYTGIETLYSTWNSYAANNPHHKDKDFLKKLNTAIVGGDITEIMTAVGIEDNVGDVDQARVERALKDMDIGVYEGEELVSAAKEVIAVIKDKLPDNPKESDLIGILNTNGFDYKVGDEIVDIVISELVAMGIDFDVSEAKDTQIDTEISNLFIKKMGRDTNGNKTISVGFPNDRGTSIQINKGNFPDSDSILRGITNLKEFGELSDGDKKTVYKELADYVKNCGSKNMQSRLKIYEEGNEFADPSDIKKKLDGGEPEVKISSSEYITKDGSNYNLHAGGFIVQKGDNFDEVYFLSSVGDFNANEGLYDDYKKGDMENPSDEFLNDLLADLMRNGIIKKTEDLNSQAIFYLTGFTGDEKTATELLHKLIEAFENGKLNEGMTDQLNGEATGKLNESYDQDIKQEFPILSDEFIKKIEQEWKTGNQTGILDRISTWIAKELGHIDQDGGLVDKKGYQDVISKTFKIHKANEYTTPSKEQVAKGVAPYVVKGTLDAIKTGTDPDKAFSDAADDENLYGDREDIVNVRNMIISILKDEHETEVKYLNESADDMMYSQQYERDFSKKEIENAYEYYVDYMKDNDISVDIVSIDEIDEDNLDEILYYAELQGMSISENFDREKANEIHESFKSLGAEIVKIGKFVNIGVLAGKINKDNHFDSIVDIITRVVESDSTGSKQHRVDAAFNQFMSRKFRNIMLK